MKRVRFYSIICIIATLLVVISGCKKTADEPLQLPPTDAMVMDFNFTSKAKSASETSQTSTYHTTASIAVLAWSAAAYVVTFVPAAAFKEALNQKPVFNDVDKVWEWVYTVKPSANETYQAKLTGKLSEDSVKWEMYLSKVGDNSISNFKWFEGKSHYGRKGGWWILNYPRFNKITNVFVCETGLYIKWVITSDNIKSLQYISAADSVVVANSIPTTYVANEEKGGYIKFGIQEDPKFNAYYDINSVKESKLWEILWNTSSQEGQIKCNAVCVGTWDSSFNDKACE